MAGGTYPQFDGCALRSLTLIPAFRHHTGHRLNVVLTFRISHRFARPVACARATCHTARRQLPLAVLYILAVGRLLRLLGGWLFVGIRRSFLRARVRSDTEIFIQTQR